jgi:hypothetical protein
MRVQVRGKLADGQQISEGVDWPSMIPAEMGMTVRFAQGGIAYEGEIQGVTIDVTPQSAGVPRFDLTNLREAPR